VALLVLLALLAAVGLHGNLSPPVWGLHSKLHDAEVAGALDLVAIVLLLGLWVRSGHAPKGQPLSSTLRTALAYLLGSAALALTVTLVLLLVGIQPPGTPTAGGGRPLAPARPGRLPGRPESPPATAHFPVPDVLYALISAALVVAIVVVVQRLLRESRAVPLAGRELPAEEYGSTLQEAIAGGRRALLELDDARAAIIACYVEMEDCLARAGATRSIAETPDELLAKAAGKSLISAGAASQLTALFYEARFSSHRMGQAQKEAAERALAELEAEVAHGRGVQAGAEP